MRRAPSIAAFLFVALSSVALADEPTDPAELLRAAKSAETVDRDVGKALELYRKVVEVGGTSDAARDAALKVAELLEAQGKVDEAFDALRSVTERFTPTLDAEQKRRVHEAMLRLLAAGGRARSPLGEVHKPAPSSDAAGSPLAEKIHEILATPGRSAYEDLRLVGTDALPVLEQAIVKGPYETAKRAASVHAQIGGVQSIPVLERIVRTGDPFARGAAVYGMQALPRTPEVTEVLAQSVDRLLAEPSVAGNHESLVALLRPRLTPAQLMQRHRAGGPYDLMWLRAALDAKAEGAAGRALELARTRSEPAAAEVAAYAMGRINLIPQQTNYAFYNLEELRLEDVRALADRLLAQADTEPEYNTVGFVLGALARHGDNVSGGREAWDRVLRIPPERRPVVARQLLGSFGPPPKDFLEDRTRARQVLPLLARFTTPLKETPEGEGFWGAATDMLRDRDWDTVRWVTKTAENRNAVPPDSFNAAALEVLERTRADLLGAGGAELPSALVYAAARTNDPRYLALLRSTSDPALRNRLLGGLVVYRGPGLLEFVREAVPTADTKATQQHQWLAAALGSSEEGARALLEYARERTTPMAGAAVERLSGLGRVDALRQVAEAESVATSRGGDWYLTALIQASANHRVREAIPFLLREFRTYGNSDAQSAMTAIRSHYDQVASFEEWLRKDGARGRAELATLLADGDPEIRRAAVLSLAALGDKESLPQLVRIAKDEKDPRVRQAALQAVERLATAPPAPKSVPAAPTQPHVEDGK